jgi:hypothetical protein
MLRVCLAKSYDDAINFLKNVDGAWVAIETEYGDNVLDSNHPKVDLSLNHHGSLQNEDAPALIYKKHLKKRYDNFIISHIDLDVLFGILWTAGWLKKTTTTKLLSKLVATADIYGFHAVAPILETIPQNIAERYYAIGYLANSWVINDNGQSLVDISREVHKLLLRIKDIILDGASPEQISLYTNWFAEQEKAAKIHLKEIKPLCRGNGDNLFIFRAPFSLTTAYEIGNIQAKVIVQYNEQSKSISLSCFDEQVAHQYFGEIGVIEPLQKFFGEAAGGKKTIGGTPRDQDIQPEMLSAFVEFLFREYFNVPEVVDLTDKIEVTKEKTLIIKDEVFIKHNKDVIVHLLENQCSEG